MGILEKLRPQPRWKHTDPAVRISAVFELGTDSGDTLLAVVREDPDARVRRAAVTRLEAISVLAEIARTDPDDDVRGEAVRGLAGIAAEANDMSRAMEAARALVGLNRMREIAIVARDSSIAQVRMAAVDLIEDVKSLGSISRHARDAATRLRALGRLQDADEILNVALKSEHTDAAVAALDRVNSSEALGAVAQHGRNKVAARRARTRLRAIEEAAERPREVPAPRMAPDDHERATVLIGRAEALVAMPDPNEAATALADTRLAWAEFQADVDVDEPMTRQFEAASDAAREAIAERQQERAAEVERLRVLALEQADRLAICLELEALSGADSVNRVAELTVRWDLLPSMPSEYAVSLNRRFQDACRACEARERRRLLAEAAAGRLETLATELERLIASEQSSEEQVARWRGLRRDADVLREFTAANPEAGERLERAVAILEEKEHEQERVRAQHEEDNLRRLQQFCRQLEAMAASDQLTLKAGDRALRDVRAALDERAPLPSKKDRQDIQARLEAARDALGPRVQELRDADEWQRWANLQVQESICKEMELLKAEENLDAAGQRMRELQARWKDVALAPRAQGEAMWRRFKAAQDEVFSRTSAWIAAQNEERAANLARKQALCERAAALAESTDWVKATAEIQALQAEWKTVGAVSRGHEKAIWERFRGTCDRFFSRRQEDLRQRKEEWAANLVKKEALCEQAEALAASTEWDTAAAQFRLLQAEWKKVGPIRRSKSEVIWQRFRAACDHFFHRYKHRDQVDLQARAMPREAIIRDLQVLLPARHGEGAPPAAAPEGLAALVQDARARWQQPAPELPRAVEQDLAARYHQALGTLMAAWPAAFVGTDLDPATTRKRMEQLLARVEEFAQLPDRARPALSPAELLAQQWRERLAANTMTGGKVAVENDEARWRAAEQEVRNAQAQWMRLGPVPPDVAGQLHERFQRACRRFYDQRKRAS